MQGTGVRYIVLVAGTVYQPVVLIVIDQEVLLAGTYLIGGPYGSRPDEPGQNKNQEKQ